MKNVEELKKQLNRKLDQQKRLKTLEMLAETLWQQSEFSEAKKYAEILLDLSKTTNDKKYEASANYLIGLMNSYLNNYDEALEYQLKALQLHQEMKNDITIAEGYNNIGNIYIKMNNYEKALGQFQLSLEHNPSSARTFNNLCHAHNHLKQYDKALEYGKIALEFSRREKSHPDRARTHIFAHINLGEIYLNQKKYDKAIEILHQTLQLSQQRKDDTPMITSYYLGTAYQRNQDFSKAVKYLEIAEQQALEHQNREYLIHIYKALHEVHESRDDLGKALDYLKKYVNLDKKIYTNRMADRLAKLQANYEIETNTLKAQQMAEKVSKLASIGVMTAGITHEINQPLCAIKVSAESILYWNKNNNNVLPEGFLDGLRDISKAVNHINEIIQHMRSFWNMPTSHQMEAIDVNSAIKSGLSLIERQLYSHGIFLELELAEDLPQISLEKIHFEQIIINIVVNAMHALDETDKMEKFIRISSRSQTDTVLITVSDNGAGLPPDIGGKLYDPFFSTKKPGKGMGLGLAIVKNYIDKYQGNISAENNKLGGATFQLEFPAAKEVK
ncbi:MAG: tetratricopeptide repeat protein [Candidatus Cloacimonetes bacterium]|nr:tetratricopeptide repeat protein [Candidatus Cloacimonadota bacterium]MCF7814048.1 tetratricopeptide repeat protein [Candidatus Cloacimonadota bacterium]MCF7868650.1 tetratricopeptide repeat protein [Candidatus Cloacimonadota bacterium]MCF7884105.1 tetratricopeptide repeat protein [Candidatus Cloacimonadota bacterium]